MGAKMRDTNDELVGAHGRDDKTKIVVAARYEAGRRTLSSLLGNNGQAALKRECERLGVKSMTGSWVPAC